jgi:hypothetical protein
MMTIIYLAFAALILFKLTQGIVAAVREKEYKSILYLLGLILFFVVVYWFVNSPYFTGGTCYSYDMRGCNE